MKNVPLGSRVDQELSVVLFWILDAVCCESREVDIVLVGQFVSADN